METVSGDRHLAGPAYWEARRAMDNQSSLEVGRRWRQLRRWEAEGRLDRSLAEELRATGDEYLSRHGNLPA